MHAYKSFHSCPTLYDLTDGSLSGSSVHGILQARILEWAAMPSSRGFFHSQGQNPHLLCLLHWQVGSLPLVSLGNPPKCVCVCAYNIFNNNIINQQYILFNNKFNMNKFLLFKNYDLKKMN